MTLVQMVWPIRRARMIGQNYAISTGFLAIAGSRCYQVPRSLNVHTGWDLNGPGVDWKTPIQALLGGKVLFAGFSRVWGNIVVIWHPEIKHTTRIGHFEQINVKAGQTVVKGQLLGLMGGGPHVSSGGFVQPDGTRTSYSSHVHFDAFKDLPPNNNYAYWNGVAFDPNNPAQSNTVGLRNVKAVYVPPKELFALGGITNIVHEGGCPL